MADTFTSYTPGLDSPASGVFLITPNDAVDLAISTRAIRATVGGTVKITGVDGVAVVCAISSGETRPIRAVRVWSASTTATGLEGMY